jgi:hypothetical protein
MDFIERWLHISPDGGNGGSEILIVAVVVLTVLIMAVTMLRPYLPRNFIEYLEQLGKRDSSDHFDN